MANICLNRVVVSGNKPNVRAFEEFIRKELNARGLENLEEVIDFYSWFVSVPEDKMTDIDWLYANRGTVGEAMELSGLYQSPRSVYFYFDSKWQPPWGVLEKISERFKVKVVVSFDEPGNELKGSVHFKDGKFVAEYPKPQEDPNPSTEEG